MEASNRTLRTLLGLLAAVLLLISVFLVYAQENPSSASGGDMPPLRQVSDPYPVFNGIAIDPENNLVAMTDVNRKSLLSYARSADSPRGDPERTRNPD